MQVGLNHREKLTRVHTPVHARILLYVCLLNFASAEVWFRKARFELSEMDFGGLSSRLGYFSSKKREDAWL